tara:strand:- start:154 stop:354 length:201 start_codon:yes stop_codon:yes gene_type:complete
MDIETQSIEFLDHHTSTSFSEIMNKYVIQDVFWLQESNDCARPYATFFESNLITLFPIFCPEENNS